MSLINTLISHVDLPFVITGAGIGMVVLLAEIFERTRITHGEYSRKLTHIIGGVIIGLSAFYLNQSQLLLLCFLLTVGVVVLGLPARIVKSLEAVKRPSIGQYIYAAGIAMVLIFFNSRALFMAATLTMSLADGIAALVGWRYGVAKYRYKVIGGSKTTIGSLAFFVVTFGILLLYLFVSSGNYFGQPVTEFSVVNIFIVAIISVLITLGEALVAYGFDNIVVPLLTAGLLAALL